MAVVVWLLCIHACGNGSSSPVPSVEPARGPCSGYFSVQLDLSGTDTRAQDVTGVTIGGVTTYNLETVDEQHLSFTVQGRDTAGPAEVLVSTIAGTISLGNIFKYQGPSNPHFQRIVAFGASLTQGVQRGVPSHRGTLRSPAAVRARQVKGYLPLPVLVPGLFPEIGPDAVGPPPECVVPDVAEFVTEQSLQIVPRLTDPETRQFSYALARVDPGLSPSNLAVGGSRVQDLLHPSSDLGVKFLSHLVYAPDGDFLSPVETTQLDELEARDPTLVISFDLYGNDVVNGIVGGEGFDIGRVTPIEELKAGISQVLSRLAATKAESFIANMPRPSALPLTAEKSRRVLEANPTEDVTGQIVAIDQVAFVANAHLAEEAQRYANVHVVDLWSEVEQILEEGRVMDGTTLRIEKFGGLVGVDGVHFSDTGYALLADIFIKAINSALGTRVPAMDFSPILAEDRDLPQQLQNAGLNTSACR